VLVVQSRASSFDTAADNLCGAIVRQQAYNEILPKKFVRAVNAARKPARNNRKKASKTSVAFMHHLLNFLFLQ